MMHQIKLNFQQPTLSGNSLWRWVGLFLLMAGIGLNALLIIKNQELSNETKSLTAHMHRINQPVKVELSTAMNAQDELATKQLKEANAVIQQLNLPWPNLFKTLEDTRTANIDLLTITPNPETGDVQIMGQAESLPTTFDYIAKLKNSHGFLKVELNDHQMIMYNGAQSLRFIITAKWLDEHA